MSGELTNLTPDHCERLHALSLARGVGPRQLIADIVVEAKDTGYRVEDLVYMLYADAKTEHLKPMTGSEFQAYTAGLVSRDDWRVSAFCVSRIYDGFIDG